MSDRGTSPNSAPSNMLPHLLAILAFVGFHVAHAFYNVTIDDSDLSVVYSGNWNVVLPGYGMFANDTYRTAENDSNAYATVTFTGVAVYYLSQRWIFPITTDIALDDGPAVLLDLQEYQNISAILKEEYGQALVIASATGLENREHTVRISVGSGEHYAVMDKLIFTALNTSDFYLPLSSPPTSFSPLVVMNPLAGTPPAAMQPSTSPSKSKSKTLKLAIGFGVAAAVLALLTVFVAWRFLRPLPTLHVQEKLANDNA